MFPNGSRLILLPILSLVYPGCCGDFAGLRQDTASQPELVVAPLAPQTPAERIKDADTLPEAYEIAAPFMDDVYFTTSEGTLLLTAWALRNMRWDDVAVEKDETTHGQFLKDPEMERGKRLCWRGKIIQIEADRSLGDPMYVGLLYSSGGDLYHFYAVGSTGDIVPDSRGRVCGVVTGKYDYANSANGTSHAIELVGMFDLPDNKRRLRHYASDEVERPSTADARTSSSSSSSSSSSASSSSSSSSSSSPSSSSGGSTGSSSGSSDNSASSDDRASKPPTSGVKKGGTSRGGRRSERVSSPGGRSGSSSSKGNKK